MRLNRKEFIDGLNELRDFYDFSEKFSEVIGGDITEIDTYFNQYYFFFSKMCELPEKEHIGSDLDYYCFELDFGRKYEPGMVTVKSKEFPLKTPEDLWELILEDNSCHW